MEDFVFTNCGNPATELFLVNQLNISPDPIPSAGAITVNFEGSARQQIVSPVKVRKMIYLTLQQIFQCGKKGKLMMG